MVAAALWSAERRFGIAFKEITGTVPVFHPDVRVWEVVDTTTGAHRALFLSRQLRANGKAVGRVGVELSHRSTRWTAPVTAISSNNNNFVKGAPGEPVLISLADAKTLFHEFGHALHAMLQNIRYRGLAITPRDYRGAAVAAERALAPEPRGARSFRTPLSDRRADAAIARREDRAVQQIQSGVRDARIPLRRRSWTWTCTRVADGVDDIATFEHEALARVGGMPREVVLRHRLPHFDHLFGSDSYSAGYYSYLWSDVMAADAWQAFVEAGGPWDAGANERLRTHILSDGNSIDRAEAYRRFRGRDPDIQALLDARGFAAQVR